MHVLIRRLKFLWIQKACEVRTRHRFVQTSAAQYLANPKTDYFKKLFQKLGHQKLVSNASTYESLISQSKSCPKPQETTSKKPQPPSGRHKFHKETEDILNQQITEEFNAAFSYLSMACYFGRTDIALPGCQGYFMNMHVEELSHAIIFVNYVLMRGASVALSPIQVPDNQDWKSVENAFAAALEMEKRIKEKLGAVYDVAEKHKDLHVMDLISTEFEEEQNKSICELARLSVRAKMAVDTVGEYLFDEMVYDSFVKKSKDNLMYKSKLDDGGTDEVYK
ncbi:soma ferritin [Leptinotarsa decemlineata]|uniref:soma ferritin n=1 Tax=Leptinotarsa decemlineata TaxID=7539 RepID=UPI003D308CE7